MEYSDARPGTFVILDRQPYAVLSSHVFRKQMRKPVNQTKLKNLITGKIMEYSFHQADTVEEAEILKREALYLYNHRGEWWFAHPRDPKDRFTLPEELLGNDARFFRQNTTVSTLVFNDKIIGVSLPIKMRFKVTDAPPNVKGNTAQGGGKPVTIETGATVTAPMFVKTGDTIEVNTQTGEYTQRVT